MPNTFSFVPGGLVSLNNSTLPQDIGSLTGRILLDGIAMPIVPADVQELYGQVPWEVQTGQATLQMNVASESPFRQNQLIEVLPMEPRFLPLAPGEPNVLGFAAVHGDFSGFLTETPHPGDVFIMYATGMGRVIGTVQTGEPTPADMPHAIQGEFHCRFIPYTTDAKTLFAGLAPGLIGIYQINFQLPSGPDPGPVTGGSCQFATPGVAGGFGWGIGSGVITLILGPNP